MRKILFYFGLFLLLAVTLSFGFYKSLPIMLGPKLTVASPTNGQVGDETTLSVRGEVKRASALYVNGVPTLFTEHGIFETRVPLYRGNNLVLIEAMDKYGRSDKKMINVGGN